MWFVLSCLLLQCIFAGGTNFTAQIYPYVLRSGDVSWKSIETGKTLLECAGALATYRSRGLNAFQHLLFFSFSFMSTECRIGEVQHIVYSQQYDRGAPDAVVAFLERATINQLANGIRCPSSHPYTCALGTRCSSTPFKATSGPGSDCDGLKVGPESECCPPNNDYVVPCSNETGVRCWDNPSKKVVGNYAGEDDTYRVFDLSLECETATLPVHPMPGAAGRSVSSFRGDLVTCGGRLGAYGSPLVDACHRYNASAGAWEQLGGTMARGRKGVGILVVDEGTSAETMYVAGGNVHAWSTTEVDVFNGVSLSLSATLAMPTDLFGFSIAQIDADHFMVVGGGHAAWQPQNDETFIYSRATGVWSGTQNINCFWGSSLTVLSEGQIYYFCGDSVLAYDASALLWTPVEGIHPALTLTGGKALAIGSSAAYASAKWNVTESIVKFEGVAGWSRVFGLSTAAVNGLVFRANVVWDDLACN